MLEVKFLGPSLDAGPLPTVFYFALSANDSLFTDPYNQPAVFLSEQGVRVLSITLPGHDILPATDALSFWAKETGALNTFIDEVVEYISLQPATKIGVMGLSRGVFIAAHVAARAPKITHLLGFAPLTGLGHITEFEGMDVREWDLTHLSEKLYNKTVRCYIGNHDTRVGTENCCQFITKLAKTAYHHGIRSSPIELVISPSIGRFGHGTSPETFRHGTNWLLGGL
jgi:esterase FrsA